MSRSFRLTRQAEDSLVEIALWTIQTFGSRQANLYEAEIVDRCEAIAKGQAASRSCAILVANTQDLRFVRAGEHFLVFVEQPDEVVIVDILHSRSDLPRHVAALSALMSEARKDS